jgi:polysaccharide deacetylase 2 family uncharacterized protein YibQ
MSAATLEVLGPPPGSAPSAAGAGVHAGHAPPAVDPHGAVRPGSQAESRQTTSSASRLSRPGRDLPGPVADPDPSLLEPYSTGTDLKLPRIAIDGRPPMVAYAAGFDPTSLRPRVGILIAGVGLSEADSMAAIKDLPGGVTLAFSPYVGDIGHLLAVARMAEHEYLLSIPMEPQGYPVNDPDDRHALMTSLSPTDNLERLRWVLSRLTGYVGVTNALGQMHGERLMGVPDQFASVLEEVGHRGLLFVDARIGRPTLPFVWNRSVDIVVDAGPVDASVLDERLDALTHTAQDKGSALGLVQVPRPVALSRVAAWTTTLTAKGLALAPVSALVQPPGKREAEK